METTTKTLLALGIVGGGSGASLLTYDQLVWKPERIERKGFEETLKSKKHWKFISTKIGMTGKEDLQDAVTKIKNWCDKKMNKQFNNYEETLIFLDFCRSKFSTLKNMLEGINKRKIIEKREDYEVSVFFIKQSEQHREWFKGKIENINHENLKKWCDKQLNEKIPISEDYTVKFSNEFCKIKNISTIGEYISNSSPSVWTITSEKHVLENIFRNLKSKPKFIELIKKHDETIDENTSLEEGGIKLKAWCMAQNNQKLSENLEIKYINILENICKGWHLTIEEESFFS